MQVPRLDGRYCITPFGGSAAAKGDAHVAAGVELLVLEAEGLRALKRCAGRPDELAARVEIA